MTDITYDFNGVTYREWGNVPQKDIACYEYNQQEEIFPLPPEAEPHPELPNGTLTKYEWHSNIYYPGVSGDYYLYVPEQYQGQEMGLMVFMDGNLYLNNANVPNVLDYMIAKKEIPEVLALFINPGDKGPGLPRYGGETNRSIEYDSIDNKYADFLIDEIFPEIKAKHNVSADPDKNAIVGISSSGNAAFAAAWNRPDTFRRVMSHLGSFTCIRGGHEFPYLIRQHEKKPIRVFLQTGEHDLNTCFGNWKIANQEMASALEYKDYDYKLVIGNGSHSLRYGASILPDSLLWLWQEKEVR